MPRKKISTKNGVKRRRLVEHVAEGDRDGDAERGEVQAHRQAAAEALGEPRRHEAADDRAQSTAPSSRIDAIRAASAAA